MRQYLWLGTLGLVTIAAMLAATITKAYLVNRITAPLSTAQRQAGQATGVLPSKVPLQHYDIVIKRNIFNANPPKPSTQPASEQPVTPIVSEVPVQPLQLRLVGAVTGGAGASFAIFEDKTKAGVQAVYQTGDMVQQARIVEIRPDCVILERNGQPDKICFEVEGAPTASGARQSSAVKPTPAVPAGPQLAAKDDVLRVDGSTWQVRRDLVLEQFANFGSLSEQANAIPYSSQGQPQGFRLTKLKTGSFLQQIGLRDGDVLRKVNDLELRSPQEALQAYQQLQNARTVRLEILRRNQPTTFTYELR